MSCADLLRLDRSSGFANWQAHQDNAVMPMGGGGEWGEIDGHWRNAC